MNMSVRLLAPTYKLAPTQKTPTTEANTPDDSYGNIHWSHYLRGDSTKDELKSSVCRVNEVYNKKTRRYHLVKASKPHQQKLSSKYVLVLRHTFSRDGRPTGTYVDIRGDSVRDILADIFRDAENVHLAKGKASLQLRFLYYAFDELKERIHVILDEELKAKDLKADEKAHFEVLKQSAAALMLTTEEFGSTMAAVGNLLVTCDITFDLIWTLLPPNEVVFALDKLAEKRVYWAHGHEYQREGDGSLALNIDCGYVDDDGKRIGRAQATIIKIPQFEGKRKITDLPIFPLKYHPEKSGIREELLARGRTRLKFRQQQFHEYNGLGLTEVESADGRRHLSKFNSRGRIVIDHDVYAQMQANDSFVPYITKSIAEQDLTDDDILTFPSMAYGFSLKDKVWGAFAVSNITNIIWDQYIFNSLVLSDIQKRLVRTLVRSHISQSSSFDDLIREKGKGLIGLLVGPPGVGKTLTAEAVAEEVKRPLYVLSSGELGSSPEQIELNLKRALELAQTWSAVLLLDEADVFLSKRSTHDLIQTAIVSIFLRQLEYYQGILIMTTNRVESMDSAFESRVHFCIEYPELDHSARKRIWREFLVRAEGDKALNVQIRDKDLDEIALAQLNGRQIKNVMKMAQCVAIEDKKALDANVIKSLGDSLGSLSLSFKQ